MIELITFIHYNLYFKRRHAVTLTMVDYSKAFNRQDHNVFITLLHVMNVPGWLLQIIVGLLTDRRMELTYQGGKSEQKPMSGGDPAGTTLGLLMFVVLINNTANPGQATNWGLALTQPIGHKIPIEMTHAKMIDDASISKAIDMESALITKEEKSLICPLTQRERYELAVPPSLNKTLVELDKMVSYADAHYMKMNPKKT